MQAMTRARPVRNEVTLRAGEEDGDPKRKTVPGHETYQEDGEDT